MSMAHALEVRVPFLDHHLVEYIISVPDIHKQSRSPKKMLVDALNGLLPSDIVNRPKMGFVLPWTHWLKNELFDLCNGLIGNLSQRPFMNAQATLTLWKNFQKNDPAVSWARIWLLIVLEHWLEQHQIEN